jgi:hypothetical protein
MIVVAGLDPATHLFRETLFEIGWIRGLKPAYDGWKNIAPTCRIGTFRSVL